MESVAWTLLALLRRAGRQGLAEIALRGSLFCKNSAVTTALEQLTQADAIWHNGESRWFYKGEPLPVNDKKEDTSMPEQKKGMELRPCAICRELKKPRAFKKGYATCRRCEVAQPQLPAKTPVTRKQGKYIVSDRPVEVFVPSRKKRPSWVDEALEHLRARRDGAAAAIAGLEEMFGE